MTELNWYDRAYERLLLDIAEFCDITEHDARNVYSYLVNVGLIDYDIEKDVFSNWSEDD